MAISAIFGRVKSATLFMTRLDPAQNGFVPNPIETPAAGLCVEMLFLADADSLVMLIVESWVTRHQPAFLAYCPLAGHPPLAVTPALVPHKAAHPA